MTLVCDTGPWKNEAVPKKSPATDSCAAKASAQSSGVKTVDGWSVAVVMASSKFSLDNSPDQH